MHLKLILASTAAILAQLHLSMPLAAAPLYSIGEPTPKEQLYVELINRARANPTAEGIWLDSLYSNTQYPNIKAAVDFFSVNRTLMKQEFVTGSSNGKPILYIRPPLAINSSIMAAARLHSQDQIDNDFQGHTSTGTGFNAGQRMTAQGYTTSAWGENAFTAAKNVFYGHAGFQIDWGGADGTGMQGPPRGHRSGIHSASYREIGVGNLTSEETTIPSSNSVADGPEICTQDFGRAPANTPFITGVAYYDLNGNNFYDIGEGVGGINITTTGASFDAVTSTSGGYAIPIPGNGNYDVSFSPSYSSSPTSYNLTVTSNENIKQDLILTYNAPGVSGTAIVALNDINTYEIDTLPGASNYSWQWGLVNSSPTTEDADQGSGGYDLKIGNNYSAVQTTVTVSGNAFRLVDAPQGGSGNGFQDQILTLTRNFILGSAPSLQFKSRVTWMYSGQHAKVQISDDAGLTWQDTSFDQAGSNGSGGSASDPGETSFVDRSVDLSTHAGKTVLIRFILDWQFGSILNVNPDNWITGWYLDNIIFDDMEEIAAFTEETIPSGNSFTFSPATEGTYRVSARANLLGGSLPHGDFVDITVASSDFTTWLTNNPSATGGHAGDPEIDGVSNLLEYAFGLNPALNDAVQLPVGTYASGTFTMATTRPTYDHTDLTYEIQSSADLTTGSWVTVKTFNTTEPLSYSAAASTSLFYRWKITLNP